MHFTMLGLGTAVPREAISQDDAARWAIELREAFQNGGGSIRRLYRQTGIKNRRTVLLTNPANGRPVQDFFPMAVGPLDRGPTTAQRMGCYETHVLDLAAQAVQRALADAGVSAEEISQVITVSCTGFSAPGFDIGLFTRFPFRRDTSRTHVGFMGCHGALNGLRVASALAKASSSGNILLCCVELCSVHHQYTSDARQIVANALFSDGAAAVVGSSLGAEREDWQLVDQQSSVLPETSELMSWRIGDNGFEMTLSPSLPDVVRRELASWLVPWLARHGLGVSDVHGWAIHPGGPRMLSACGESLGLDDRLLKPSREVLAEFGNMSSPTVLFILERLRLRKDALPCVMLAFGPGLTMEAALFDHPPATSRRPSRKGRSANRPAE